MFFYINSSLFDIFEHLIQLFLLQQINYSCLILERIKVVHVMHYFWCLPFCDSRVKSWWVFFLWSFQLKNLFQLIFGERFQTECLFLNEVMVDFDVFWSDSFDEDVGTDGFFIGKFGFVLFSYFHDVFFRSGKFMLLIGDNFWFGLIRLVGC